MTIQKGRWHRQKRAELPNDIQLLVKADIDNEIVDCDSGADKRMDGDDNKDDRMHRDDGKDDRNVQANFDLFFFCIYTAQMKLLFEHIPAVITMPK